MRHTLAALWLLAAVGCVAPVQYRYTPLTPADTLPPWPYGDMVKAVLDASNAWKPSEVKDLELLAWYAKVDDRPLYVNVALFWAELSPSLNKWALVKIAQNPVPWGNDKPENRRFRSQWHPSVCCDCGWEPVEMFNHPPTTADIQRFMREWDDGSPGWVYLTSGVRAATWKRLIGEEPPPEVIRGRAG
jgi:hypothetical protein